MRAQEPRQESWSYPAYVNAKGVDHAVVAGYRFFPWLGAINIQETIVGLRDGKV